MGLLRRLFGGGPEAPTAKPARGPEAAKPEGGTEPESQSEISTERLDEALTRLREKIQPPSEESP